jgi:hypothetical protein
VAFSWQIVRRALDGFGFPGFCAAPPRGAADRGGEPSRLAGSKRAQHERPDHECQQRTGLSIIQHLARALLDERERIYQTPALHDELDMCARANLERRMRELVRPS